MNANDWRNLKLRTCRTMHGCRLCKDTIHDGERYFDGGHGRRAHQRCVDALEVEGKPISNTITSTNAVPIFATAGCGHGPAHFGPRDFDFAELEFLEWDDLFAGMKPGDRIRVTLTAERVEGEPDAVGG